MCFLGYIDDCAGDLAPSLKPGTFNILIPLRFFIWPCVNPFTPADLSSPSFRLYSLHLCVQCSRALHATPVSIFVAPYIQEATVPLPTALLHSLFHGFLPQNQSKSSDCNTGWNSDFSSPQFIWVFSLDMTVFIYICRFCISANIRF